MSVESLNNSLKSKQVSFDEELEKGPTKVNGCGKTVKNTHQCEAKSACPQCKTCQQCQNNCQLNQKDEIGRALDEAIKSLCLVKEQLARTQCEESHTNADSKKPKSILRTRSMENISKAVEECGKSLNQSVGAVVSSTERKGSSNVDSQDALRRCIESLTAAKFSMDSLAKKAPVVSASASSGSSLFGPSNQFPSTKISSLFTDPNFTSSIFSSPANSGVTSSIFNNGTEPVIEASEHYITPRQIWISPFNAEGMTIQGTWIRSFDSIIMDINVTCTTFQQLRQFGFHFQANTFGLKPVTRIDRSTCGAGKTRRILVSCNTSGPVAKMTPLTRVDIVMRNNLETCCFSTKVPLVVFFDVNGKLDGPSEYKSKWNAISEKNLVTVTHSVTKTYTPEQLDKKLALNNIFTVYKDHDGGCVVLHQSIKFTNGVYALARIAVEKSGTVRSAHMRCQEADYIPDLMESYRLVLQH